MRACVIALACLMLGACVGPLKREKVQPWARGDLARPEMAFDLDPATAAYRQHLYFSKESASGGGAAAGGGCGCN